MQPGQREAIVRDARHDMRFTCMVIVHLVAHAGLGGSLVSRAPRFLLMLLVVAERAQRTLQNVSDRPRVRLKAGPKL